MDLDLRGELQIGGVWVDATGNLLTRQSLTHSRGRADLGARTEPSTLRPLLNNTNGQYSFDNPRSVNYGLGGRNTPFRLSARAGTPALDLPGNVGDHASTPDAAALDIVGDLDVRLDATLLNWLEPLANTADTVELMAKFASAAGTKSWLLGTRSGALYFRWSADGTNILEADSTVPLPVSASGRIAVRATLDTDNGASGNTVTFYVSDSISGTWTQLGDPVVQSGTTSIFNSATVVKIGDATDIGFTRPIGRVHKAEIRNGINGTLAANPDFTVQTIGVASFVDGAGRTWTMNGGTSITNRRARLHHELTAAPTRWHPSGKHIWVPAETRGILRRYSRSGKALDSTLRRRIPSYEPLAYWPMEDGEVSTQAYSPITGVGPLKLTNVNWAQADSLPSSNPLPVLASSGSNWSVMSGQIPAPATTQTSWQVQWIYRLDTPNTSLRTYMRILTTGTIAEWYIQQGTGTARVIGKDSDGNTVFTDDTGIGTDLWGQWIQVQLEVIQNGGNVDWQLVWIDVGGDAGAGSGSFAGTVGRPTRVASPPDGYSPDLDGMAIGHISAWSPWNTDGGDAYEGAIEAWTGETAGERMQRLADEENLPLTVCGVVSEQTQVGVQRPAAILNLLEDAADVDGGVLYEDRERLALRYRGRATMYNQTPALVLDYTSPGLADPLESTPDDEGVVNDVEVQRIGGSRARAFLQEGALSVQAPPDGVGTGYDQSFPLNLHADDQAEPIAYWRMWLGTYEGRRYPQVRVMVHQAGSLIDQILAVDVGDKIVIRNPPDWLPPGDIELLVQGYEETFSSNFEWDIVFNCTPAVPWTVGVAGSSGTAAADEHFSWADTDGCVLAEDLDTTETAVDILTTEGEVWSSDGEDFPYDWRIGGEVMTVTAPGGLLNDNPFFDTNVTGWSVESSTLTWSTTFVHPHPRAAGSMLITPAGGAAFVGATSAHTPVGSAAEGAQYTVSCWVYSPAGWADVRPTASWYTSTDAFISTTGSAAMAVPAGQWTYLEATFTAPATASRSAARVRMGSTPSASDVLYVWAARITRTKASWLHDTFSRTVSSGWGTSDSGLTWSNVGGGSASDYSISGSYGVHTLTTVDTTRRSGIAAVSADFDLYCDITTSALATGASLYGAACGRMQDGANLYMCRLEFTTSNAIILTGRKVVGGTQTQLGSSYTLPFSHVAGTFVRIRFQGTGSTLKAKAWAIGTPEPGVWHVETTDSDLTAAQQIGTRSIAVTGNTNPSPEIRYDNFDVINPQAYTVTRSQNGIVKSHSGGADVRLADPAIVAL